MSFATDTAVVRVGPRCFTAELHDRWSSLVGIHGGYSAAIVVNAMTATVDDPSRALRSFAAQFAAAPRPGPVDIEVTVERAGRSMTTTSARLLQEGQVLQVAHAVAPRHGPASPMTSTSAPGTPTLAMRHGSGPLAALATSRTPTYDSTPTSSRSVQATKRW